MSHIVRELPADLGAAVFVAMHFPTTSTSVLPRILARAGKLPAEHGVHGERIRAGHLYVAPPDRHLIVLRHTIQLSGGVRDSDNPAAVDAMFASAALGHGRLAIGVVLTGNLHDGTAGLLAIKRRGGVAIVQDPADAPFPSMPASAIGHVSVDFVLPLAAIPAAILKAVAERGAPSTLSA